MASGGARRAGGQHAEGGVDMVYALTVIRAGESRAGMAEIRTAPSKKARRKKFRSCGEMRRAAGRGIFTACRGPGIQRIAAALGPCRRVCAERREGGAGARPEEGCRMPLLSKKGIQKSR